MLLVTVTEVSWYLQANSSLIPLTCHLSPKVVSNWFIWHPPPPSKLTMLQSKHRSWRKSHNHLHPQFLLTVSISLRFSTSCLLSLISLDATHVLIWSRRRWGTRRRRRGGGGEREAERDTDTWVNSEAGAQTHLQQSWVLSIMFVYSNQAWRGVWSSWQHWAFQAEWVDI